MIRSMYVCMYVCMRMFACLYFSITVYFLMILITTCIPFLKFTPSFSIEDMNECKNMCMCDLQLYNQLV